MKTIAKNIGKTSIDCPLIELLTNGQGDHDLDAMNEWTFGLDMETKERQWNEIKSNITRRNGSTGCRENSNKFSNSFVAQQAIDRYYDLMSNSLWAMYEIFSASEMSIIFSIYPSPVLRMNSDDDFASALADSLGIESSSDIGDRDEIRVLLSKLTELTPAQHMALVDACEQFFRSTDTTGGVREKCRKFGLILNSD